MSPISAHPIADPTVWAGEMRRFDKADRRDGVPSNVIVFTGSSSIRFQEDAGDGHVAVARLRGAFVDFCEKILAATPSTPIYFISIKPPKRRIAEWPRMQVANRLIRDYCASDERLHYIDVVPPSGTAST